MSISNQNPRVAYFCMEYGLDSSFPIYSGGLGILAGDIIKAAKDLNKPFFAVGIFWSEGYTRQTLDESGEPVDAYPDTPRDALEPTGIEFSVEIRGKDVAVTAYKVTCFGNIPLYLMEPIHEEDRWLSKRLYSGDDDVRVAQEVLLGIGGVRMLQALGIEVDLYHFNEGHALFAGFELLRPLIESGKTFDEAKAIVKEQIVFTTHTPVPAGNEVHSLDRLEVQGALMGVLKREDVAKLGGDPFQMTPAALRLARSANGVAELHGATAEKMWAHVTERPFIQAITNGVHMPTWQDSIMASTTDDDKLWARHMELKQELLNEIERLNGITLDPEPLLIGFARRAATYKRATLVLRDLEWLEPLIEANRIRIVFSGKAHPKDEGGKDYIRAIAKMAKQYPNNIIFLQDYSMHLGALLTRGCDVWLNTPRRPQEASGTSGMKAAANGVLNVSILDGWWAEGCDHAINGWQFGDGYEGDGADEIDLAGLKAVLSDDVLPTFYEDRSRWLEMMRASIQTGMTRFSAQKMVSTYYEKLY
jgi:starch phosphorylase